MDLIGFSMNRKGYVNHELPPSSGDNFVSKSSIAQASPRSIGCSACCLFSRRPLCQEQTTTCGREVEFSECVERRHALKRIIDGRCDRSFAVASQRPALIGETIETVVAENEMVEQPDAQEVSSFPQACGERPILSARCGISGRVVMNGQNRTGVEEDRGFEHFTRVHNTESERADRDDIHADADVLGIETTDEELFAIETVKARA